MRYHGSGISAIYALAFIMAIPAAFFPPAAVAGSLDISAPLIVDLNEILPLLEKAPEKGDGSAEYHTALGGLYINSGTVDPGREAGPEYSPPDFAMAEKHLEKAISLDPKLALPRYYMGILEISRQDFEKALGHLKKALELTPGDLRIHQQIHTLYFAEQKYATAALFLEESVKEFPDEENLHHRLAVTYLSLNMLREARASAKRAIALNPDPETRNLLGAVYMKAGNYAMARGEFEEVLKGSPENMNAMLGMARAYGLMDDYEKAARWAGKALALDPDSIEAREFMRALQEAGDKRK